MALISQSDLEARLGRSLTADEETAFTTINSANQAFVERAIIGSSTEAVSASTRYFDGGKQHLPIDPCTSVTALALVDDDQVVYDTFDTTDYTVESVNRTMKTMLRYRNGKFPIGIRNLALTAKFSIYEDTEMVNIVKDALLNALEIEFSNTDNIKKESIEGYSVEFADNKTKTALQKLNAFFPNLL